MKDEEGGLIILTLLLLISMLIVGGMAVDFMRHEKERVALQGVIDHAVLSAASLTQDADPESVIEDFVVAAGYDADQVTTTISKNDASGRIISATATSEINTFYLRLAGIDSLSAAASTRAEEGVNLVEVSLVLDYSASMRTGGSTGTIQENSATRRGRIGDLQDAARAFAAELLKPEYDGRFSINIVPYGGHVNPGPDMFGLLNGTVNPPIYISDTKFDLAVDRPFILEDTVFWAADANDGFPGEFVWAGADGVFGTLDDIVLTDLLRDRFTDRLGDSDNRAPETIDGVPADLFGPDKIYGTTDDNLNTSGAPALVNFRYYHPAHCMEIGGPGESSATFDWSNSDMPTPGGAHLEAFMRYNYKNWEIEQQVRGWGWCLPDAMQIQYAMQDLDDVEEFFDKITLGDGTGTDIGMKWGLSLLDPSARPYLTALNGISSDLMPDASLGRPADWDDPVTDKVLVLMTDGFITRQSELRNDQQMVDLTRNSGSTHTVESVSVTETKRRFLAICDLAKSPERNVTVHTVAFETNAAAAELMRDCADEGKFNAASGAGLTQVFEGIARQITALRLTQ